MRPSQSGHRIATSRPSAIRAVGIAVLVGGSLATLGSLPAAGLAAAAPAASRWSLERTANPSLRQATLFADSCSNRSDCIAVGTFDDASGTQVTLAEAWNGTSWRVEPTPNPAGATDSELHGVSCSSPTVCMAVGWFDDSEGTEALAEAWNGSTWSVQSTPNPTDSGFMELDAVSCAAPTACVAVGNQSNPVGGVTLAESWDGTSWTIEPTVNPPGAPAPNYDAVLGGVSCTAANSCTAAGWFTQTITEDVTLVETWDGTAWTVEATPNPAGATVTKLSGVSCSSASTCTAVGLSYSSGSGVEVTLAERWNGRSWKVQSTPNPAGAVASSLGAVSCSSAIACTAVGSFEGSSDLFSLAEAWNGTTWSLQTTPNGPRVTGSVLEGVSCRSSADCRAVGFFDGPGGALARIVDWNGVAWSVQASPDPPGPLAVSELNGVSCTSRSACTAVGYFQNSSSTELTLAEAWDGSGWKVQRTPNPADAATFPGTELFAVSCSSRNACMAVGSYADTSGIVLTLAESWNGTTWTILTTPDPSGATNSALEGVSCASPSACTAVGRSFDNDGVESNLVESWNGAAWTLQTAPAPAGATGSDLSGVSCGVPPACTAVGSYNDTSGLQLTLAEVWDGTTWTVQPIPDPSGATASALVGVSCASLTDCMAVGHYYNNSGTELTLAESWNGTAWNVEPTPNRTNASASSLDGGVSCGTANACAAVGTYENTSGTPLTLAEGWNGAAWTLKATPNPVGAIESELTGVSCNSASACTAVGYSAQSMFNERTLAETTA